MCLSGTVLAGTVRGSMFRITVALIDDEFKIIETHKYSEELAQ